MPTFAPVTVIAPVLILTSFFGVARVDGTSAPARDPRADYDVEAYRLDLRVDPTTKTLSGTVVVEARAVVDALDAVVLDLAPGFTVERVDRLVPAPGDDALDGTDPIAPAGVAATSAFRYEPPRLVCPLATPARRGELVRLAVRYSGQPKAKGDFDGFHWARSKDGRPWISTSSQGTGSSYWWPSKDSYFHPEDKPARVYENYTVPADLYAVGNGRLDARTVGDDGTATFRWVHEYPLETYSVTLNAAAYTVVETKLDVPGNPEPVPFAYYVLPENAEKAALQFRDVPGMLAAYSRAFGPFPFPKSKFALVETSFWGMEHSTAVAYGSSYPAWIREHGGKDPYASRNRWFDYILVHESAHEWWGNAVSARAWGDFWIHEGFATYAEAVYLEATKDAATAQQHMDSWKSSVGARSRLFRGEDVDSGKAYAQTIYSKGAWVLHTLRQYVDDDEAFWRSVRAFQAEFRYGNATTQDFRAVLERETKREWKTFFDEWVYGTGYPKLEGKVRALPNAISISITNTGSHQQGFHVPIDLTWTEGGRATRRRVELSPGANDVTLECGARPEGLALRGFERILADRKVTVE